MDELERIRAEYGRRRRDLRYNDWYSPLNAANTFIVQERDREIARLLAEQADADIASWRVLDVGCGSGDELAKLIGYGVSPRSAFGVDLLIERVVRAREKYGNLRFLQCDAGHLPYANASFDLILQFTVFTSVLDDRLRIRMASEMLRVLRPHGRIVWYDFRLNPINRQTRGIEKKELLSLFPKCRYLIRRVTLAPPIARRVAAWSWIGCALLSQLFFLKTHYLALIWKEQDETRF